MSVSARWYRARRVMVAVFATLIASTAALHAQALAGSVTAGFSRNRFTGDGINQVEYRNTPFVMASLARHPWQSRFGIEGGVAYAMKGSSWIDGIRNTLRLNYVEAQALLRLAFPIEEADLRPVLFAGPAVGYLVTCEMHGSFGGATETLPCDDPAWDNTLDVRDVDAGLTFGGMIELRTRGSLVVAPRIAHTRGFQQLGFGPEGTELDAKNASTVIGITVSVPVR